MQVSRKGAKKGEKGRDDSTPIFRIVQEIGEATHVPVEGGGTRCRGHFYNGVRLPGGTNARNM